MITTSPGVSRASPTSFRFRAAIANVGCAPSTHIPGSRELAFDDVRVACGSLGIDCTLLAVRKSSTEPTLVLLLGRQIPEPLNAGAIAELSRFLRQDCIAVQPTLLNGRHVGEGFLAGPHADACGPFNPAYFFAS
jgi:hypothetical protein